MAVTIPCPKCGSGLRLREAVAPGRKLKCPNCSEVFPASEADGGDDFEVLDEEPIPSDDERDEDFDDRPRRKRSGKLKKKKKSGSGGNKKILLAVGAIAALLMLAVGGFAVYWLLGSSDAAVLAYIPDDSTTIENINVAQLRKNPTTRENIERQLESRFDSKFSEAGLSTDDLDQLVTSRSGSTSTIVFRFGKAVEVEQFAKAFEKAEKTENDGRTYYVISGGSNPKKLFMPNSRTAVVSTLDGAALGRQMDGEANESRSEVMNALVNAADGGDVWNVKELKSNEMKLLSVGLVGSAKRNGMDLTSVATALESAKGISMRGDLSGSNEINVRITLVCSASDVASTAAQSLTDELGKNRDQLIDNAKDGRKEDARQLLNSFSASSSGPELTVKFTSVIDSDKEGGRRGGLLDSFSGFGGF